VPVVGVQACTIMTALPTPEAGRDRAEDFVRAHLSHLVTGPVVGSNAIAGGQRAADAALQAFDVAGYSRRRNEVFPARRRGASKLSPYIRHGLLSLGEVWDAVRDGPTDDVKKFRDELLWQEFARHWYARLGARTSTGIRRELTVNAQQGQREWDRSMRCVDSTLSELETGGWLVNQSRMWLASQWAVRDGNAWQAGEDFFFQHLLDGSRAANRLGWQWTTGVGSSKSYGFSQWQVLKRAPGLCEGCVHGEACPIADWPDQPDFEAPDGPRVPARAGEDPTLAAGPEQPLVHGPADSVWLTAESLGASDPALGAEPGLPVVFVFDEPLLGKLALSAKRLVFLVEALAELGEHRDVELMLGDPVEMLATRDVAVTFAPVPGFATRADIIGPVATYPWRWLRRPTAGSVSSFSGWRKSVGSRLK